MAYRDDEWLKDYFSSVNLLDKIRTNGYAIDNCEHHDNGICVGAPIFSEIYSEENSNICTGITQVIVCNVDAVLIKYT